MNVWLVTTGSSDIQLTSKEDWPDWWQDLKTSLHRLRFEPVRTVDDDGEPYRLPARVLGLAYEQLADEVNPKLTFPLLQAFAQKLKAEEILLDQIIILMSDQVNLFTEEDRETKRCPYWQDTCLLYPIFIDYFHQHFPKVEVKPLLLKPQPSNKGLDDWDTVLELVQQEITGLQFEKEPKAVYVSHQAGTPAISSAVQFCSLARFGDRVKFLVSNEQDSMLTNVVESSAYLKGIKREQARKLLDNYDYSGVNNLVGEYLQGNAKSLLDAALQWNVAKFSNFLQSLNEQSIFGFDLESRIKSENWWWRAYEEVYLAKIRRIQGNIVEAFFHSFRAFEYIFYAWGDHEFGHNKGHIEKQGRKPYLKSSVLSDAKNYFSSAKFKQNGEPNNDLAKMKCKLEQDGRILLDFSTLHKLFRCCRAEYKTECQDIEIFWDQRNNKENNISEKRNIVFHQIEGMSESDLWIFWNIPSTEKSNESQEKFWEYKLLKLLNFIVKEDFPEGFSTLEKASLMVKVHQELKNAIATL